jgi:hypothetical protein
VPHVVVPIEALDASARQALAHAQTIVRNGSPIMAIHVAADSASAARLRRDWEVSGPEADLVIIESAPEPTTLLAYLELLESSDQVTVVLPDDRRSDAAFAAVLKQRPGIVLESAPREPAI